MSARKALRARLRSILRPRAADERMDEEFRFHVEMETEKNVRAGMDPAQARRRALVAFGGVERHRESMRAGRGARGLEDLARDLRVAARTLAASPGFALTALATIALGVGATTAVFSAVDAVLLRSLPFARPAELVVVEDVYLPFRYEGREGPPPRPDISDARNLTEVFAGVAAYAPGGLNLSGGAAPRRVGVGVVTPDFFDVLGVLPRLGRPFSAAEGEPGGPRVAIVSHGVWRSRLGADADLSGRSITLNGREHAVVGVMPAGFTFPEEADVWVPLTVPMTFASFEPFRQYMPSRVLARLAPGVGVAVAGERLRALVALHEEADDREDESAMDLVRPLREALVGERSRALLVLLGATVLLLLIASANVASLLLSRALVRRREIALRCVLGATPGRVVRQLLAESLLLAAIGGALGVGVAVAGVRLLDTLVPAALAGIAPLRVDLRVLGFASALALVTGVGFGLWPALRARRADPGEALGAPGPAGGGAATARLRRAFVIGQVALAVVLLVGCSLMLRSLGALMAVDAGVAPERVATLELSLADADFPDVAFSRLFFETVIERLEAIPRVEAAAAINELPLRGEGGVRFTVQREGAPAPAAPDERTFAQDLRVTPHYFRAMGIDVLRGRAPRPRADTAAPGEVAINETLANGLWPDRDPIGERLAFPGGRSARVVGVVADVRPSSLASDVIPQMYGSLLDVGYDNAALVVRGRLEGDALVRRLVETVHDVAPAQAVYNASTMEEVIAGTVAPRRTNTLLLTTFGLLALLLAAVGVYGVMAFGVARRTREIGIRVALGARPGQVVRGVVAEGLLLALAGVALGSLAAWMLARVMGSLVFGIAPRDPISFAVAPAVLLAVTAAAALVPARRAAGVDPLRAIAAE